MSCEESRVLREYLTLGATMLRRRTCLLWGARGLLFGGAAGVVVVAVPGAWGIEIELQSLLSLALILFLAGGGIGFLAGRQVLPLDYRTAARILDEGDYRIITAAEFIDDPGVRERTPFLFEDARRHIRDPRTGTVSVEGGSGGREIVSAAVVLCLVVLLAFFLQDIRKPESGERGARIPGGSIVAEIMEGTSPLDSLLRSKLGPVIERDDFLHEKAVIGGFRESLERNLNDVAEMERSDRYLDLADRIEAARQILLETGRVDSVSLSRAAGERDVVSLGSWLSESSDHIPDGGIRDLLRRAGNTMASESPAAEDLKKLESTRQILRTALGDLSRESRAGDPGKGLSAEAQSLSPALEDLFHHLSLFRAKDDSGPLSDEGTPFAELEKVKADGIISGELYGRLGGIDGKLGEYIRRLEEELAVGAHGNAGEELASSRLLGALGESLRKGDYLGASREAGRVSRKLSWDPSSGKAMRREGVRMGRAWRQLPEGSETQALFRRTVSSFTVNNRETLQKIFDDLSGSFLEKNSLAGIYENALELKGEVEAVGNRVENQMISQGGKAQLTASRVEHRGGFLAGGNILGDYPDPDIGHGGRPGGEETGGWDESGEGDGRIKGFLALLDPGATGEEGRYQVRRPAGGRIPGKRSGRVIMKEVNIPLDPVSVVRGRERTIILKYDEMIRRYYSSKGE